MPQTVSVARGRDDITEPGLGDVVVSRDGRAIYMVVQMFRANPQWADLKHGTLHFPGDMSERHPSSNEPHWRFLTAGERVTLEI